MGFMVKKIVLFSSMQSNRFVRDDGKLPNFADLEDFDPGSIRESGQDLGWLFITFAVAALN